MNRLKGIAMIITGATLWGATGPMMEWLLKHTGMSVSFMLIIRLLVAGLLLLLLVKAQGKEILLPWRQKVWARQLLIFGVVGMLGVQFTFVAAIDTSNAVIATLFQFLAPIYILVFLSSKRKTLPPLSQVLGIILTLGGLFLLLTNGSLAGFALGVVAVMWGISLGFTFSFYTLYPARLMQEWGVIVSVGWAMVIGGVALFIVNIRSTFTQVHLLGDWQAGLMLLGVIVVGTTAFTLFLGSMKYISAIEASILSCFEPLTAMIVSAVWFGQLLGIWQLAGAFIMLSGVTWISIAGSKANKK